MPKFQLQSPYSPQGDQPYAIDQLCSWIKNKNKHQTLLGVTGSGKTFTMANVIQKIQKPTLVISHNKTLAAQLASEFQCFFPDNAVHYFVSYYDYYQPEAYIPQSDTYIEKETQINEEIDRLRHASTQALLSRKDVIIVASVSCIYALGSPVEYKCMALTITKGDTIDRNNVLRKLAQLQFSRNDIDFHRGTFRVRGDILEIYPVFSLDEIVRIEFFGNTVEAIRILDSLTGKSKVTDLPTIDIYPATHYVAPQDNIKSVLQEIRKDMEQQVKIFTKQGKLLEAQRIQQRTKYDVEMMEQVGYCNGIENYSRYFDKRTSGAPPYTLLDYFPKDYLLCIDESHMTIPQIGGMYAGDQSRKQMLINYGFRLPSALDNRPLNFPEFSERTGQIMYVSATPGPYEVSRSTGISADEIKQYGLSTIMKYSSSITNTSSPIPLRSVSKGDIPHPPLHQNGQSGILTENWHIAQQVIRPTGLLDPVIYIKPSKNQIDDVLEEVKHRTRNHQRVLITTLTKRMAEELADYFQELHIKAQYLHADIDTLSRIDILRDLRKGVYDVLIGINLLREGLDLPEVSLVIILDADKEGFLRSETALIQTIGRAARHIEGTVIMYADSITGSMQRAIDETNRRHTIQEAYNTTHGITPQTIIKIITEDQFSKIKKDKKTLKDKFKHIAKEEIPYLIKELTAQMDIAAKNLEFEKATELRDLIHELQKPKKSI